MAITYIPVIQDPNKTYRITLDGVSYDITLQYNQRLINQSTNFPNSADEFTISVSLTGEDPIFKSPLKTNRDVLEPYKYRDGCPQGSLMLRDVAADSSLINGNLYAPERVSYSGIGTRFVLLYSDI
ncbi:hypothetical protein VP14_009 [Vibrio phage VPMCC14]|nr:hypothetical protein VP14_009 [Vibrio phage VPMCC14]